MITVACVEWGDYYGRGAKYVRALKRMVSRHLSFPHRFVCLSDKQHQDVECIPLTPGRTGWWNKLELFRHGLFDGRVMYLDLDTVVVGSLDALSQSPGIIHLRDWGWTRDVYGSGVMVWDSGQHSEIWDRFDPNSFTRFHGDQDWITELGGWDRFPPELARSYRYHCKSGVPDGCSVVCFHGEPKPHQPAAGHLNAIWEAA